MRMLAVISVVMMTAAPTLAGNIYCAAPVRSYQKAYVAPQKAVYAHSNYVEKVTAYPAVTNNIYNVYPEQLIKSGQTHYAYAKIGEYAGFDANLAIERLNRSLDTAASSVPALGQLVAQTISTADAQKHNLYLHQSESASVVAELRELKEVVRELRAGRQSSTTAVSGGELPDGALAVQAGGLQTCVKCHQKYSDPSKLSLDEVQAAIKKIHAGEMPLGPDKATPVPLSADEAAAVISELFGAGQ